MMYITMKKLFLLLSIFFIYATAFAADVSVIAPTTISNKGQFNVQVNLNTDNTSVNSVDITITYPKDILSFKGYKEDGAIKKIWLTSPKDTNGVIHFSGIIPGGVDGVYDPDKNGLQPIPLVQLLFSAKGSGTGTFAIIHSDILQNDGVGTSLVHEDKNARIVVSLTSEQTVTNESDYADKDLPDPFVIEYIQSGLFSETPSMISFFATDASSGIEKYQMKNPNGSWKDVVSPLPIPRGILKREVIVRAIDFAGNSRESDVEIPGIVSPLQLLGIIIFCLACYFTFFVVKRKR